MTPFGRALTAGVSLAALAAVVACGGGGGGSSGLPGGGASGQAQATFTIAVPSGGSSSSALRRTAFVSPNAQSVTIAVAGATTTANLTPTSPGCTPATATVPLTCTVTLYAPPGNDSFTVTLYAGLNGGGTVLASSTVSATVSATQPTVVPVTLGGVVSSIDVTVTNGNNVVPGGFATTLPVVVTAKDPSGAAIVGAGNYTNPITLTNADTSGVTQLSTTAVTSSQTVVTLAYAPTDANSGELAVSGMPIGKTVIGATANGVPASAVSPGVFQYNADRFAGFGHTRTLTGTAIVTQTNYNAAGVATGSQVWTYNVADVQIVHSAADVVAAGGAGIAGTAASQAHRVITYAQTSPVTATAPEVHTDDTYRHVVFNGSNAIFYLAAEHDVNVNSGAAISPVTGNVPGEVDVAYTYPPNAWQIDVLPHATSAWSDSNVPYSLAFSNAEVATFQVLADGSTAFSETVPAVTTQTQTAAGAATNFNGSTGVTTTIGLPAGGSIPVAIETTSPLTPPATNYTPVNWYPGGAAPVGPLYNFQFVESSVPIPAPCNVPAAIATQAFAIVETDNQLDVADFHSHQGVTTDYYVPGGAGFVCEIYVSTNSAYRFTTGIIAQQTVETRAFGVPNVTSLGARRTQGR